MDSNNLNSEKELLLSVSKGDEQAFQQLLYHYSEKVFFHALTFVKSWQQAEEIVQDIFLRVWQKREKLVEVDNWDKYLFTLSKNFLINAMKKRARFLERGELNEVEDMLPGPDDQYANKELGLLLQKAFNQLPEQKRLVFEMIHQNGLTQEEVSKILGIATRTVRWNLVAAINEIKDFLHRHSTETLYFLLLCLSMLFS